MKRLSTIMMCLLAMMVASLSVKAQEITIDLMPGWTWISYPKAEVLDVNTAFGDFVPAEGDMIQSQYSNSKYIRGRWIGGVTHFIPGWGYKYYSNRTEIVSFVFAGSTPQSQVTVTTSEPLLITAVSAMGGGEVTTDDGIYILAKGLCWATHENPTTNEDDFVDAGSGVGSFSASMDGINIATTYYVRAYAVTADGTTYGDQKTFTTRDGIPEVSTASVTNILGNGATCGGTVTDNGGLNVIARGVCWSMSHNPTVSDSHTTNGSGLGSFSSTMTGMDVSTAYYVRAYATTSAGTAYGEEVSFTTRDGIPDVSTSVFTRISVNHAICGGVVTDEGGLNVVARGVCWSTMHNPIVSDCYTTNGSGLGSFTSTMMGLMPNTTYYVRAYASTSAGTTYGDEESFTTMDDSVGGHVLVDLYLPSGLLWATCNVGSDSPENYGDYFAWGETQLKDIYNWSTYQYCNGSSNTLTRYCSNSYYGYNGFTDNLTSLLPEDDAATANWGSGWRTPTMEEWSELINNTTNVWTTRNNVWGRLFTSANGNSLFLPAAGLRSSSLFYEGSDGYYWSNKLDPDNSTAARCFHFYSNSYYTGTWARPNGYSVRPVRSSLQN